MGRRLQEPNKKRLVRFFLPMQFYPSLRYIIMYPHTTNQGGNKKMNTLIALIPSAGYILLAVGIPAYFLFVILGII